MSEISTISLALQGGGAHGAFTWGVLDTLLERGNFRFDGVSGTSAGAMNAVCLAHGLMEGGADGARQALERFWLAVADTSPFPASGESGAEVPVALKLMLRWTDHLTPEQLNPLDLNPLRDIVAEQFDFARLRRESPVRLFIAATHANTGQLRLFRNAELSADTLLASACLPTIHRTVVIDGEPYWDGGYSANPAVFPLAWECSAADLLLILLTPLRFAETPGDPQKGRAAKQNRCSPCERHRFLCSETHAESAQRSLLLGSGLLGGRLGSGLCSLLGRRSRSLGSLACGSLRIDRSLEGGTGGELGQLGGGDLDLVAGAGVHAIAGGTRVLLERTETGNGHGVALFDSRHHGVEQRVEDAASLSLGQLVLVSKALDEISLVHE